MRYAVQQDQLSLTGCPAVGTGWHLVSFTDLFCGHILLNMQASDAKIAASFNTCMAVPRDHVARSKSSAVGANPGYADI